MGEEAPVVSTYVPGGASVQEVWPVWFWNVPTAQSVGEVAAVVLTKVPTGESRQEDWPVDGW